MVIEVSLAKLLSDDCQWISLKSILVKVMDWRHQATSHYLSQCWSRSLSPYGVTRVTEFNFLGITINEFMNWGSHSVKIANKICRTLGVMNCLKRYLPLSALKIMYDSLILSHIQFGITCWGFEWGRLAELQKEMFVSLQTVNIMRTQNRYLKICIYWKLSIYLMSSVWNFGHNSTQLIVCTSSAKTHWYSMNKPVVINYRQYLKGNIHNVLLMTMVWVKYIQFSVGAVAWYYLSH